MAGPSLQALLAENRQLRQRVAEQQRIIEQQQRTIEQLQQAIRQLHERLDAAERAAKRQAAPFSTGQPKERPKQPGRKKGEKHGRHGHRPPPPENKIDEVLEGCLPCECPHCRGTVEATHAGRPRLSSG